MPSVPAVAPVVLSAEQMVQLLHWSRGGSTPYRLVIRAQIVLLASYGHSNRKIARLLRVHPLTVSRWRSRFELLGLEGISREAPRCGSPPPLPSETLRRVLEKTLRERPPGRRHWSTRSLAQEVGVSHTTVRRIWKAHGIRPGDSRVKVLAARSPYHPVRVDLAGVFANPPQRAVVLSVRPIGEGARPPAGSHPASGTLLEDHPPAGRDWMKDLTTTLALLENPTAPGARRRHLEREFLSFLRAVAERRLDGDRMVVVAESEGPSISPSLVRWLSRHPEVSARVVQGSDAFRETLTNVVRDPGTGAPCPESLPGFQSAVVRWKRESPMLPRPFAWRPDTA